MDGSSFSFHSPTSLRRNCLKTFIPITVLVYFPRPTMQIHQMQFFHDKFLSLKQKIPPKNTRKTPFSEKKPKIQPTTSEKKTKLPESDFLQTWKVPLLCRNEVPNVSSSDQRSHQTSPSSLVLTRRRRCPFFLVFFGATASFFLVVCLLRAWCLTCSEQWALALNEAR